MFDIGWGEMFLIGVVALIVVGPKDLPALFRTVGNFMGKARGMAREFQRSMEQAANESGMSDVSNSLKSIDRTLNSATGSARKFAQTMTAPAESKPVEDKAAETISKPVPAETAAAPASEAPRPGEAGQGSAA